MLFYLFSSLILRMRTNRVGLVTKSFRCLNKFHSPSSLPVALHVRLPHHHLLLALGCHGCSAAISQAFLPLPALQKVPSLYSPLTRAFPLKPSSSPRPACLPRPPSPPCPTSSQSTQFMGLEIVSERLCLHSFRVLSSPKSGTLLWIRGPKLPSYEEMSS